MSSVGRGADEVKSRPPLDFALRMIGQKLIYRSAAA